MSILKNNPMVTIMQGMLEDLEITNNHIDHQNILLEALNLYNTCEEKFLGKQTDMNFPQVREICLDQVKQYLISSYCN